MKSFDGYAFAQKFRIGNDVAFPPERITFLRRCREYVLRTATIKG